MIKLLVKNTTTFLLLTTLFLLLESHTAYAHLFDHNSHINWQNKRHRIDSNHFSHKDLGNLTRVDSEANSDLAIYITNEKIGNTGGSHHKSDRSIKSVNPQAGKADVQKGSQIVILNDGADGYPEIFLSGKGFVVEISQDPAKSHHNQFQGRCDSHALSSKTEDFESNLRSAISHIKDTIKTGFYTHSEYVLLFSNTESTPSLLINHSSHKANLMNTELTTSTYHTGLPLPRPVNEASGPDSCVNNKDLTSLVISWSSRLKAIMSFL